MGTNTTAKSARGASAKEAPRSSDRNRASTKASTRTVKIQPNPVAERAGMDAYDELVMFAERPARAVRTGQAASRVRKPAAKHAHMDAYDDSLAPPRKGTTRKKSSGRDPYDELIESSERAIQSRRREPEDEFDRYIARMEGESPKKRSARHAKDGGSRKGGGKKPGLTWLLTALILVCFAVAGVQLFRYANFIKMRNAVDSSTYFAGTTVEGVDVASMTLNDAISYWDQNIESQYTSRTVTLDDGTSVTAPQMGYQSDYRTVLEGVWNQQKSGSLKQRYDALKSQSGQTVHYDVTRTLYDDSVVRQFATYVASGVDSNFADAKVAGFDMNSYAFTFTEGRAGATLDQEKLVSDIETTLTSGSGTVVRQVTTHEPSVSAQDLEAQYGLVASAITDASSSTENRLTNIKNALGSINGLALDPGEEFSFNGVVGQRTAERGYKMAKAFSGGEVTEELGGGICQVSTTLFNAAVKANLQITERNPHSMPVSYVDKGKDATVNWGSQDLKFKNNTNSTIYIVCGLTSDKRVKVGIFGRTLENGIYITVDAQVVETYDFKTTYQENAFLAPGAQNVIQEGRTGYKAVAYKMTWAKDGSLLDKEVLCTSTYGKRDAIIEVSKQ